MNEKRFMTRTELRSKELTVEEISEKLGCMVKVVAYHKDKEEEQ